ncbi:hypothetical protein HDV05_004814 [Chytridiales sp. JEL 0842]|nr:hypothetical protein HDV05_004814 [Chytridiales sp. JEL 0842]
MPSPTTNAAPSPQPARQQTPAVLSRRPSRTTFVTTKPGSAPDIHRSQSTKSAKSFTPPKLPGLPKKRVDKNRLFWPRSFSSSLNEDLDIEDRSPPKHTFGKICLRFFKVVESSYVFLKDLDKKHTNSFALPILSALIKAVIVGVVTRVSIMTKIRDFASFWPVNGVGIGFALTASSKRELGLLIPFMVIAQFVINYMRNSPIASFFFTLINFVESVWAYVFIAYFGRSLQLGHSRTAIVMVLGSFSAAAVGGALGALFIVKYFDQPMHIYPLQLLRWFVSDALALICVAFIAAIEIGLPYTYIPEFSADSLPLLGYILSFPMVLACGSLVGPIGFTASTLCLGVFAAISIAIMPTRPTDEAELDRFLTDANHQLLRLQWFLTVLVGSSLVFMIIQGGKMTAYRELEKGNRQKSAFMAFLCHELRNPLHAILNVASFLKENAINAEQLQLCDAICASSSYMSDLINDVLDTSKLEAGKVHLEALPVCFAEIVQQLVVPIREGLKSRSIGFELEVDSNIPPMLLMDPTRVKQVLSNLLSNAVKFTPRNGKIRLAATYKNISSEEGGSDGMLTVQVSDTGIGISSKVVEKLFKPFEQANVSTSREYGGTGLGLAICKQIVDLMQGTISVKSEIGAGSTFTMHIPVSVPDPCTYTSGSSAIPSIDLRVKIGYDDQTPMQKDMDMPQKYSKSVREHSFYASGDSNSFESSPGPEVAIQISEQPNGFSADSQALFDGRQSIRSETNNGLLSPPSGTSTPGGIGMSTNRSLHDLVTRTNMLLKLDMGDTQSNTALPPPNGSETDACKGSQSREFASGGSYVSENGSGILSDKNQLSSMAPSTPLLGPAERGFSKPSQDSSPAMDFSALRVLVVDDSAINRKILVKLLKTLTVGTVDQSADGQECVDNYTGASLDEYHIIFMDIEMPVMNGIEAAKALRKMGAKAAIVAVTGNHIEDKQEFLNHGFSMLAPKPFLKADALRILSEYAVLLLAQTR